MIGRITLDIANGPTSPIALVLAACFAVMVLVEFGILGLWGMRPIGKAFTSSFLVNMAAVGAGSILYMIGIQLGLGAGALIAFSAVSVVAVQGLVLAANRGNLTLKRAWMAAISMKCTSYLLMLLFAKIVFS